ncbi:hypothetical protein HWV62_45539 [Athelia sp. TMB]|nr:hypothetical protein HWV62_45539 [Athelia sp. TMB]
MAEMLPPFLVSRKGCNNALPYYDAIFEHEQPIGPVHALWWPCKRADSDPNIVLLFIPGTNDYKSTAYYQMRAVNELSPRQSRTARFLPGFPLHHSRKGIIGQAGNTRPCTRRPHPGN